MTEREVLKLALEALEVNLGTWSAKKKAIPAIKEVLAQPEPVIDKSAAIRIATSLGWEPKRAWVGLTLEEIWDSTHGLTRIQKDDWVATDADLMEFAHIVEAKLKVKNA